MEQWKDRTNKENIENILKKINWDEDKASESHSEVWAMAKTIFLHFFILKITCLLKPLV